MLTQGVVLNGRYRLDERVATGGMGAVWRCTDTLLDRTVAVKVLLPSLVADPEFTTRFHAEARMMAALRHPGIVAVHDFGQTTVADGSQVSYLVMEYVDGEPLVTWIRRAGRLDPASTMSVVAQAAQALHVAHTAGIVHRDVKPGNLMVKRDGSVVLVDFGIARSATTAGITAAHMILGTASYMSPEQAAGQPVSPATDVYALGVVAYYCLAGQPPFVGDSPLQVAMRHVQEEPAPLPTGTPPAVVELVSRALAKSPTDRHPDAAALAGAALDARDATLAVLPVPPRPPWAVPGPAAPVASPATPPTAPPPAAPVAAPASSAAPSPTTPPPATSRPAPPPRATPSPAPPVAAPVSSTGPSPTTPPQPTPAPGRTPTPTPLAASTPLPGFAPPSASAPTPPYAPPWASASSSAALPPTGEEPTGPRRGRRLALAGAAGAVLVALIAAVATAALRSDADPAPGDGPPALIADSAPRATAAAPAASRRPRPDATPTAAPTASGASAGPTTTAGRPTGAAPANPTGAPAPTTTAPRPTPTAPSKPNPYTPVEACGSGYKVIDSATLTGSDGTRHGRVYLLYHAGNGFNCAVTIKESAVGTRTAVSAYLEVQGRARSTDSGSFEYYAGPVRTAAGGTCVKWGGSAGGASYGSAFEHCD